MRSFSICSTDLCPNDFVKSVASKYYFIIRLYSLLIFIYRYYKSIKELTYRIWMIWKILWAIGEQKQSKEANRRNRSVESNN